MSDLKVNFPKEERCTERVKINVNRPMRKLFRYALFFIIIYFVFNVCLFNAVIPSSSMENTIKAGDKVIGSRLSYLFGDVERGDIVIFKSEEYKGKYIVKRVVGLPGEVIDIKEGCVYVDGSILEESYVKLKYQTKNYKLETPYTVPDGCYFLLGDNRNNSEDSRFWKEPSIAEEDIVAKVIFRYAPVEDIGRVV